MRWPRLPEPARDFDGLARVGRSERRLSLALVVVASVWFALAASWELFGPLLAGHYAASASQGIVADNMLRWGIFGPVWEYTASAPTPAQYYCHHPWGTFWTTAVLAKVLGHHDFVCRLPAVLCSAITPPLLYLLGRALWRPAAGAVAAAAFVVLPITLSFANFNALEVPVIAWTTLGCWAFVRHQQTWRRRYLLTSLLGFALALHADWPAYVLLAVLLAFGLLRGILLRRALGRVELRAHARWWALTATLCVATLVFYLVAFQEAGKLGELLQSYRGRSQGSRLPLAQVLAGRRYWIELMFTPVAIALGKAACVVGVLRLLLLRKPLEVVPLALLIMATVQYVTFKQAADIHIYWPHYFGQYFALGMGGLVATAISIGEALARRRARGVAQGERMVVAVVVVALLPLLVVLRDGVDALVMARQTGGRFNEKGLLIHSDGDKNAFLRWLEPQLDRSATVAMHEGMKLDWSQVWSLGGRVVRGRRHLPTRDRGEDIYLADTRFLLDGLQAQLAASHQVVAVGPFWRVLRRQPQAPIEAFTFSESEPSAWSWYFRSGTEPLREIEPDPFRTWELRVHFDQPATAPTVEPRGLDQIRIAHNAAAMRGDPDATAQLLEQIHGELDPLPARFDDGTELLGRRFRDGVRPTLWLLFRAQGPAAHDAIPVVRARVVADPRWSTSASDPTVREVAPPPAIAPLRWRKDWLYSLEIPILARPGRERFELAFRLRNRGAASRGRLAPRPADGSSAITVLELD